MITLNDRQTIEQFCGNIASTMTGTDDDMPPMLLASYDTEDGKPEMEMYSIVTDRDTLVPAMSNIVPKLRDSLRSVALIADCVFRVGNLSAPKANGQPWAAGDMTRAIEQGGADAQGLIEALAWAEVDVHGNHQALLLPYQRIAGKKSVSAKARRGGVKLMTDEVMTAPRNYDLLMQVQHVMRLRTTTTGATPA